LELPLPFGNLVSDLAPLTGLTQLAELDVATNQISNVHPLVLNAGIGAGDVVNVSYNYLCITPGSGEDIPDINVLLARGVSLDYDPQYACQEDGSAAAFRVTSAGDVRGDGAFYGADLFVGSADVAEWVTVAEAAEPGTVLELDTAHPGWYRPSEESCSGLVAGVVSSEPGVVLGGTEFTPGKALLAITGIVPVKVTNEGGPIQLGDLLVSSSTCGYAMRWAGDGPCPCSLVGKALEPMTDECGVISVLLTAH
jgi:hypothetical protein